MADEMNYEEPMSDDALNTGIVDVESANRRVWLVKVPDYLAQRINDLEEDNLDLGIVRASHNKANGSPNVKLILSPNGPCGDLPKEYTMNLTKCRQTMHLFCEDVTGKAVVIEGKIEQECQLKPILNDEYKRIMQRRDTTANKPKRTLKIIEEGEKEFSGMVPLIKDRSLTFKKRRKVDYEQRKDRIPRADLTDILFRAFERSTHLNFKDLCDQTQQPSSYLKDVLSEIAIYNVRGPFKNLYELKPEYKK